MFIAYEYLIPYKLFPTPIIWKRTITAIPVIYMMNYLFYSRITVVHLYV